MGLLDGLLGNLDLGDIAAKLGVTPEQVQQLVATLSESGDLGAVMQKAEEMGLPVDQLQALLGDSGGDLMAKAGGLLGQDGLGDMLGGLLGRK